MNRQEVFNRVRNHLLKQASRCEIGGRCMYRGYAGKKCAIGVLIADEHYREGLEGTTPDMPGTKTALEASGIEISDERDVDFLLELQSIHDSGFVSDWAFRLDETAEKWGLQA